MSSNGIHSREQVPPGFVLIDLAHGPSRGSLIPWPRRKRQRKPTLAGALKQADKAGKAVRAAELYADHIVLTFGEPETEDTAGDDPWDKATAELTKQ